MKQIILSILTLISYACFSQGTDKKQQQEQINGSGKPLGEMVQSHEGVPKYTFNSLGSYAAYSDISARPSYYEISDPTLKALNERAQGYKVWVSKSGIVGMPKHNLGFADGHIMLHTNDAATSGTVTGSGSVGTGSSPGIMTSSGPGTGLNGKNPYAGQGMYGIELRTPPAATLPPAKATAGAKQ